MLHIFTFCQIEHNPDDSIFSFSLSYYFLLYNPHHLLLYESTSFYIFFQFFPLIPLYLTSLIYFCRSLFSSPLLPSFICGSLGGTLRLTFWSTFLVTQSYWFSYFALICGVDRTRNGLKAFVRPPFVPSCFYVRPLSSPSLPPFSFILLPSKSFSVSLHSSPSLLLHSRHVWPSFNARLSFFALILGSISYFFPCVVSVIGSLSFDYVL